MSTHKWTLQSLLYQTNSTQSRRSPRTKMKKHWASAQMWKLTWRPHLANSNSPMLPNPYLQMGHFAFVLWVKAESCHQMYWVCKRVRFKKDNHTSTRRRASERTLSIGFSCRTWQVLVLHCRAYEIYNNEPNNGILQTVAVVEQPRLRLSEETHNTQYTLSSTAQDNAVRVYSRWKYKYGSSRYKANDMLIQWASMAFQYKTKTPFVLSSWKTRQSRCTSTLTTTNFTRVFKSIFASETTCIKPAVDGSYVRCISSFELCCAMM